MLTVVVLLYIVNGGDGEKGIGNGDGGVESDSIQFIWC